MTTIRAAAPIRPRTERALVPIPEISASALLGVWVFVVMGVITPSVLAGTTSSHGDRWWFGALLIIVIAAGRFAWLVAAGERRLFEMTFWIYTYVFMGLAPMAQIREHTWAATVNRTDWTLVGPTVALVLAGLFAYLAGVAVASVRGRRAPEATVVRGTPRRAAADAITEDLSYGRVVLLACVAIAFNAVYLQRVGFNQFGMTRIQAYETALAVWGEGPIGILIRSSVGMIILVAVVALIRMRKILRAADAAVNRGRIRVVTVLLIPALVLLVDTLNPISNARYLSGTAILAVCAATGAFATPNRFRVVAVLFVGALVVLFPMADAFRYSLDGELGSVNPLESLLSPDYDSFAQVDNAVLVVGREGVHYGHQFVGVLLWWFPRAAWPDKPMDTGILIADQRGYPFTNLSAPLWAETYLNAGFVGTVVIFLALGWWFYRRDTKLDREIRAIGLPSVLGCILPFYLLILLRGSMLQAMSYLTILCLCALAVRRRPSRDVERPPSALQRLVPPSLRSATPIGGRS